MGGKKLKFFLYRMLCGFLLGISVVAPGISGSVMAVMLGIYDKLIDIAANPFKKIKDTIIYLFPMGIGAGISFILFIILFKFLFENYPTPTYILFIALILGSIPTIFKEAKKGEFKKYYLIAVVIAFLIAASLGLLEKNEFAFTLNTDNLVYLSICGLIAGAVSVIPGVSISIVLMLFGVYETLLAKVASLDIFAIAPVGICFVIGLILFSKIVKYAFEKHAIFGFFAVLGFMSGSIVGIIPALPKGAFEWILSVIMFAVGLGLSVLFERLGKILKIGEEKEEISAQNPVDLQH